MTIQLKLKSFGLILEITSKVKSVFYLTILTVNNLCMINSVVNGEHSCKRMSTTTKIFKSIFSSSRIHMHSLIFKVNEKEKLVWPLMKLQPSRKINKNSRKLIQNFINLKNKLLIQTLIIMRTDLFKSLDIEKQIGCHAQKWW